MTVAPDGTIYWTERYSQRGGWKGLLRKLAPDGIVTTVAGAGDKPARAGRHAASEVTIGSDPRASRSGRRLDLLALRVREEGHPDRPDGPHLRFAGRASRASAAQIESGRRGAASPTSTRPLTVAAGNDGNVYFRIARQRRQPVQRR